MKLALLGIAILISSALAFSIERLKELNKAVPKPRYKHDCAHRMPLEYHCHRKPIPTEWTKEARPKLGYSPRTGGPLVTPTPNPPVSKGGHRKRRLHERALATREPAYPGSDERGVTSYFRRRDQHDNADARDWKKFWRWLINGNEYTPLEDPLKRPVRDTVYWLPPGLDYDYHPYSDDPDTPVDLKNGKMWGNPQPEYWMAK
ncbi:hypothetical protein BP5796_09520 [Coleophoma crateriformis]|uniref:Uncharacterized protein n=1 Tax=Coleophoma crateriformis TaxID=565419 RepID=A0A3D8QYL7_9HELO|nr:hypothetical protein BP5796_09520 [Coleophoma crateriformis]